MMKYPQMAQIIRKGPQNTSEGSSSDFNQSYLESSLSATSLASTTTDKRQRMQILADLDLKRVLNVSCSSCSY
jgi:hypothetical protein